MADALAETQIANPRKIMDRYPHELSGGMKQRVMIAQALACNPDLLIADEPTTALDVTIQAQILDLMAQLKTKLNTAILLITHNLGVVAQFCDRVMVMYAGRVIESAPVRDIFHRPQHPYTRALLGARAADVLKLAMIAIDRRLRRGCPLIARCDPRHDPARSGRWLHLTPHPEQQQTEHVLAGVLGARARARVVIGVSSAVRGGTALRP